MTYTLASSTTQHTLAVLGLYADHANTVRVTFLDDDDTVRGRREYTITTEPLIDDLPEVRIDFADRKKMTAGWTMVGYSGHKKGSRKLPLRPFMFGETGAIRWYLNLRGHKKLGRLDFSKGLWQLANGNLFFADRSSDIIFEMDMLGNIINEWQLPGFGFHHHILEKPDGNFLLTAEKPKSKTVEDWVIEVSRRSGEVVRAWDMKESLQYSRRAMFAGLLGIQPPDRDWFHANAVAYLPADDSFLVSGRVQSAVAKINAAGEAVWVLAPHIGWGSAGNGTDLRARLLQPLDSAGVPIGDADVLAGKKAHTDFDWPWYQHTPIVLPNGNILLFDNGDNRHFKSGERYSRAVEYAIDEDAMTVQQVWAWGRERGRGFYSQYVSGVEYIADTDNVIVSSGRIVSESGRTGKVVELDYASKEIIFEATIIMPPGVTEHVFRTTRRFSLIPPNITTAD